MPDNDNPYAPPQPSPGPRTIAYDPAALAAAREALAAHLADPDAVAADRRARCCVLISPAGYAWMVAAWVLVAVLFCTMAPSQFPTTYVIIALAIPFSIPVMLQVNAKVRLERQASLPEEALHLWFFSLDYHQPALARAIVVPNARAAVTSFYPHLETSLQPWVVRLVQRLFPIWTTVRLTIFRAHELDRDGDLARCRIRLVDRTLPLGLSAAIALGTFTCPFVCYLPGVLTQFIVGRSRTIVTEKHLLRGSNGMWYLLDGNLENNTDG